MNLRKTTSSGSATVEAAVASTPGASSDISPVNSWAPPSESGSLVAFVAGKEVLFLLFTLFPFCLPFSFLHALQESNSGTSVTYLSSRLLICSHSSSVRLDKSDLVIALPLLFCLFGKPLFSFGPSPITVPESCDVGSGASRSEEV